MGSRRWVVVLTAVLVVTACGNGGEEPPPNGEQPVEQFPGAIPGGLDPQPAWSVEMGTQPSDPKKRSVSVVAVESAFAALDHSTGKLTFFDAASGRKLTEHDAVPEDPDDARLSTVDDDVAPLVMVTFRQTIPAHGLDRETNASMAKVFDAGGNQVWESGPNESFHDGGWIVHTEESEENAVFTIRDRLGKDVWNIQRHEFEDAMEFREPKVFHDDLVVVQTGGDLDSAFTVHDLTNNNSPLWERGPNSVFFGFYGGIALAQHGLTLTAHDARTGNELWAFETEPFGEWRYRPEGFGAYSAEHGVLVLASSWSAPRSMAVDLRNGKLLWRQEEGEDGFVAHAAAGNVVYGELVVQDDYSEAGPTEYLALDISTKEPVGDRTSATPSAVTESGHAWVTVDTKHWIFELAG